MKRTAKPSIGDKQTGFRSPAQDWAEDRLDLNTKLVAHPASTFFFRSASQGEFPAGIFEEDLLIVDRSLTPAVGDLVLAVRGAELELCVVPPKGRKSAPSRPQQGTSLEGKLLESELLEGQGTDSEALETWGVVTHVIHACRRKT